MAHQEAEHRSSPVLLIAAWLVVILPAAWGLRYTVENALKIFPRHAAQPASSPAGTPH